MKSKIKMLCLNLVPGRVELCIGKHMNAWRNLLNENRLSFWPVGEVNHGFGLKICQYQVKPIILVSLFNQVLCKFLWTLDALP